MLLIHYMDMQTLNVKLQAVFQRELQRLPLWFPVGLGVGISLYFARSAPTSLWVLGALLAGCLALVFALRRFQWGKIVSIALLAVALGAFVAGVRVQWVAAPVLQGTVYFKQVIGTVDDVQSREKKTKLVLSDVQVESLSPENTPKRLSVSLRELTTDISIGDSITLPATLFPPPAPAMPGAYDFARMFYFDQLGAVGYSPRQPEILSHVEANGFEKSLTKLRLSIADRLSAQMGKDEGPVASALMVGEQSRVSDEVAEAMRVAGIYHILSISGLHMTLAAGILFFTVRFLLALVPALALKAPIKKISAVLGLLGAFAYLLLAGYPVPAIRSYVMIACVLLAVLLDRRGISMYSLAWAASLILLFAPESLFTASFQLSFAATLAIVALFESYRAAISPAGANFVRRVWFYFIGLMVTSLAASFFTTPLAIYHFNRMALWGIFANMLIVPLSSFWIMPAALLAFLLMPFGWEAPAVWVLNYSIKIMIESARWFATLPYANIMLPSPTFAGICLVSVGGLWLTLWVSRIRFMGLGLMVVGMLTILQHVPYDMLISDDAKRVAYRSEDGEWVFIRGNPESFEAQLWLRAHGKVAGLARKDAIKGHKELLCEKDFCTLSRSGKTIEVALNKNARSKLCRGEPEVVVTDSRLYDNCMHVKVAIDRDFVEQHGALGLRFAKTGAVELDTSYSKRGHWPWTKVPLVESGESGMINTHE